MARDAISRQFDVQKNTVKIEEEPGSLPKNYQPGIITFFAKKGKSIDIEKIHDSLRATRLSGGTNMSVTWFEITATGEVANTGDLVIMRVGGTGQELELLDKEGRLLRACKEGVKVTEVTGRLEGWNGKFPVVLKELPVNPETKRMSLAVTSFKTGK